MLKISEPNSYSSSSKLPREMENNHTANFADRTTALIQKICAATLIGASVVAIGALVAITMGVGGSAAVVALTVSLMALALLLLYKGLETLLPHLSGAALKSAEVSITLLKESAAFIQLIACYPFSLARQEDRELEALIAEGVVKPTEQTPILLVHGLLTNSSNWRCHKKRLESVGLGPIYTVDLGSLLFGSPFKSIEDYTLAVQEKAQMIAKIHGCNNLILIGHSMGGLVATHYATTLAEAGDVTDVITIGSPLQGSKLSTCGLSLSGGFSTCVREMCPQSDFIKKLNERVERCTSTRFHNLSSGTDALIIPNSSAVFPGTPEERIHHFRQMGHVEFLVSGRVTDTLCAILMGAKQNPNAGFTAE